MTITHPEMVAALVKPGAVIAELITATEADLWHGATGLAGETTELLEAVLLTTTGAVLDRENMVEEFGDLEFYIEQIRQNLDITKREVAVYVFTIDDPFDLLLDTARLAGYGGTVLDLAKKTAIYKKTVDRETWLTALGNVELYMDRIRGGLGITVEETIEQNIYKLALGPNARYKHGYSDAAAQARADKTVH